MRRIAFLPTLLLCASVCFGSDTLGADIDRIQSASTILNEIMTAPDSGIPDKIMEGAKCIAIVPSMLKVSFVFGANYGKGVATCRTDKGWSAPVFFRLTGGSFGFQAGGQASDLVLIVRTEDGMQHLLQSKFKLGGDASAAAGPVGRDAQAMTDLTLRAQVLTYSRARGLFLGVSLSGGVIRQDGGDTAAFYKKDIPFWSILNGQTPVPEQAEVLINTVEKYAPTRRAALHPAPLPTVTPAAAPATEVPAAEPVAPSNSTPPVDPSAAMASPDPVPTTAPAATPAEAGAGTPVAVPSASPAPAPAANPNATSGSRGGSR